MSPAQQTVTLAGMRFTFPSTPYCLGCGKAPPTGVISFAGHIHEPHCEACCKEWTVMMISSRVVLRQDVNLADFRAWQAQRASAA